MIPTYLLCSSSIKVVFLFGVVPEGSVLPASAFFMVHANLDAEGSEPEVIHVESVHTFVMVNGPVRPFGGRPSTRPPSTSRFHWRRVMLKLIVLRDIRVFCQSLWVRGSVKRVGPLGSRVR